MLAPGRSRSDAEIVAAMLDVLKPKAPERAALARKLRRCVEVMRKGAAHRPTAPAKRREYTRELQRYRTRLLAAKRACPWSPDALAAELARVQRLIRDRKRPRDVLAETAVELAHDDLLTPAQRTLTREGKWHRLAALLYEVATGSDAHADKVLKYMHELKRGKRFPEPLWAQIADADRRRGIIFRRRGS
jgi:hypothetical protein